MSSIKTKVIDSITGKPLGFGVSAVIVKAGDKITNQLGAGFISDDDSILEINSPLIDYTKDADAVDILVETKGYDVSRLSPEEFALQDLKLRPKQNMVSKAKEKILNKAKAIPPAAWEAGGVFLAATILIVLISKKVK